MTRKKSPNLLAIGHLHMSVLGKMSILGGFEINSFTIIDWLSRSGR